MANPPADLELPAGPAPAPQQRAGVAEPRWHRVARVGVLLLAAVLGSVALVRSWEQVQASLGRLGVTALLGSFAAAVAGVAISMLVWRALLADLGSPVPFRRATRVFFVGQLAKYIPGAVWPLLAQMELARVLGVPRRRSAAAFVLTMAVTMAGGVFLAVATLPLLGTDDAAGYRWLLLLTPLVPVALYPPVANRLLGLGFRLIRREPLDRPLTTRGVARAFGWTVLAWTVFGLHIGVLVAELGVPAHRAIPLGIGAFAVAWCVGPIVMIAPAGAGVREVALVALLAPALGSGGALVVALASRLFLTVADLLLAAAAGLVATRHGSDRRVGDGAA